MHVDLNSDLGESYGAFKVGYDEEVIPLVSSVNVACGFHAGDYRVMHNTVRLAKEAGVRIGAHPGYADLHGFGRRVIPMPADEIYDLVLYQMGALDAFLQVERVALNHVKPHGALYNLAATDERVAKAIVAAVKDYHSGVILYALAGSTLAKLGEEAGLQVASEAFVDRQYNSDGTLVPRSVPGSQIEDTELAVRRVLQMLTHGTVRAMDGTDVSLRVDTLCIHGDSPFAIEFARGLKTVLANEGIEIRPVAARPR